jgi:hypothetical protein
MFRLSILSLIFISFLTFACEDEKKSENCFNEIDDDGNGFIDCADPACVGLIGYTGRLCEQVELNCYDDFDNDGNGLVDCEETSCATSPACIIGENCLVAGDEDNDNAADCADPECYGITGPQGQICEPVETICNDGFDNDGDGTFDCTDVSCASSTDCFSFGTVKVEFYFPSKAPDPEERGRGLYIWIENENGDYIDTIQQYFGRIDATGMLAYDVLGVRYPNDICTEWQAAVGEASPVMVLDGVSTASAIAPYSFGHYVSETWDCRDSNGNPVPNGIYKLKLELLFDDTGHPIMPVFHYEGTLDLTGGSSTSPLTPFDEKVESATIIYTAP